VLRLLKGKNKRNALKIYIVSLQCSYMFRSQLTIFRVLVAAEYIKATICAYCVRPRYRSAETETSRCSVVHGVGVSMNSTL
jgi:hypothetical protein